MSAPSDRKIVFLEGGEDIDEEKEYQQLVEEATIEECALTLPRGYLSVSQVEMYRRCGLQYYYRYVKGQIIPPSVAQAEGQALHHGIAVGHTEALKNPKVPLDVMLDALNDRWKTIREDINWKVENEDGDSEDTILARGRKFLSGYGEDFLPYLKTRADRVGPFIERRFWVTVGKANIPVLGYIDLVAENFMPAGRKDLPEGTKEPEVIDHKTGSKAKSAFDVETDLQLTVYSAVTGVPRVRFNSFVKNKTPVIKTISALRAPKDWKWAQFVVQAVAESISKGIFIPGASGWWCSPKFCGYYDICHER